MLTLSSKLLQFAAFSRPRKVDTLENDMLVLLSSLLYSSVCVSSSTSHPMSGSYLGLFVASLFSDDSDDVRVDEALVESLFDSMKLKSECSSPSLLSSFVKKKFPIVKSRLLSLLNVWNINRGCENGCENVNNDTNINSDGKNSNVEVNIDERTVTNGFTVFNSLFQWGSVKGQQSSSSLDKNHHSAGLTKYSPRGEENGMVYMGGVHDVMSLFCDTLKNIEEKNVGAGNLNGVGQTNSDKDVEENKI
jgi:hypothetical protein